MAMAQGRKGLEHGRSMYVVERCRCDICSAANASYLAAYYQRKRQQLDQKKRAYARAVDGDRRWGKAYRKTSGGQAVELEKKSRRRARARGATAELVDRAKVFARDNGHCQECDLILASDAWELDHIVPLGPGKHTYDNVRVLCPRCNRAKGTPDKRVLEEWKEVMPSGDRLENI